MNALGKFLKSKLGSQIILTTGFGCCVWALLAAVASDLRAEFPDIR